jgi:PAS domain S-box-containing protein
MTFPDSANPLGWSEHRFGYAGHVPQVAGLTAAGGAALVFIVWIFGIAPVKGPMPGVVTMPAITAAAFVLAGAAVWLSKAGMRPSRVTCVLASVPAVVGLATISGYVLGWDLAFGEPPFKAETLRGSALAPGRMLPLTALSFVAFGASVLVSVAESTWRFRDRFALIVGLLGLVVVIGNLYGITALYRVGPYTAMSIYTAGLMVVLAVGLLYSHPSGGMIEMLTSNTLAGTSVRRLLPSAIAIPIVAGWLCLAGQRAGWYGTDFRLGIMAVSTIVILTAVIWRNAQSLIVLEAHQQSSERRLQELTVHLERQVAKRTQELSRSEAQLRLVVDNAYDAFIAMNQDGVVLEWNRQAETMFGWTHLEACGRSVADLIVPERHREAHRLGLLTFLTTGIGPVLNRRVALEAVHKDGHELPVELAIVAVAIGESWRFNAFLRDLTGRARSEERFRALLESAPDAMVIVDQQGRINVVNAQTEKLFGYSRLEMLDQPVEMLVPSRFRGRHVSHRAGYFHDPRVRAMGAGLELYALRRDGSEFPVEISLSPFATDEGMFVSSAIRDITAAKAAGDRLRASLQEKELLLREIHHRVKNNLQIVSSLLSLQAESVRSSDARESLLESQARVRAMALLHETLYQSDRLGDVDFAAYVESLWAYLARTIGELRSTIRLEREIEASPPDMDTAVPCALIVTELLTNAAKHAFPDSREGRIVVRSRFEDGRFTLQVSDDGIGLTDENRQEAKRRGSIGMRVIEALAGQLDATYEWSGPGTVFTMTTGARDAGEST